MQNPYPQYVKDDYLISPINGHMCKRLLKNNISKFGFNSIEELHKQYPEFPTRAWKAHVENKNRWSLFSSTANSTSTKNSRDMYLANPTKCRHCYSIVPYEKRKNVFCSSVCSATYNNLQRTPYQLETIRNKKRKYHSSKQTMIDIVCVSCDIETTVSKSRKEKNLCECCSSIYSTPTKTINKVAVRHCVVCNRKELSIGRFQSDTCYACGPLLTYRGKCNFTHDLRLYPEEYNLELLSEYGMFHPIKNPKGVSRDHKLSVADGRELNVHPSIMKHPANCEVMFQSDNTRKKDISSITLDELLVLIKAWDKKYPK